MAEILGFKELVLASHNAGKLKEISALMASYEIVIRSAGDLGLKEPEETEKTFAGNAALKAKAAAAAAGLPALADDSGLAVDALGGAPGVYSARWAGPEKDFPRAMERVRAALDEVGAEDFSARFVCVLCLAAPDGRTELFEGEIRGRLVFPPRGEQGFGYDPIFVPEGHDRTFAEMNTEEKQAMSHRGRALRRLMKWCFGDAP